MAAQIKDGSLTIHDALVAIRDAMLSGNLKLPDGMTQADMADKLFLINQTLEQAVDEQTVMQQTENNVKNIPVLDAEAMETEGTSEKATDSKEQAANQAEQETIKEGKSGFANKLFQTITETAKNSINNTLNFLQQAAGQGTKQAQQSSHTIIDTLADLYSKAGRENDYLGTFLTAGEREELLSKLSSLPISRQMAAKIVSGEATAKEVLTLVKNTIPAADPAAVQELFHSQVFENILGKFLQSSWTLTPDKLKKMGKPIHFMTRWAHSLSSSRDLYRLHFQVKTPTAWDVLHMTWKAILNL